MANIAQTSIEGDLIASVGIEAISLIESVLLRTVQLGGRVALLCFSFSLLVSCNRSVVMPVYQLCVRRWWILKKKTFNFSFRCFSLRGVMEMANTKAFRQIFKRRHYIHQTSILVTKILNWDVSRSLGFDSPASKSFRHVKDAASPQLGRQA